MAEKLPHIFYEKPCQTLGFTSIKKRVTKKWNHRSDKHEHSEKLMQQFENVWEQAEENKKAVKITELEGVYIEFICDESYGFKITSLESLDIGIRILKISYRMIETKVYLCVLVYIPKVQRKYFLKKIKAYAEEMTKFKKPKHQKLVESIEAISLAVFDSFWQEIPNFQNEDEKIYCELWLRTTKQTIIDVQTNIKKDLVKLGTEKFEGELDFPERLVYLVKASKKQLTLLIELNSSIAEFRQAHGINSFVLKQDNTSQTSLLEVIKQKIQVNLDGITTICILDSGVNNGHTLLSKLLLDKNCSSYNPEWGTNDNARDKGHGTEMAGLCGFGDLEKILSSKDLLQINHSLESVKILPPNGKNDEWLYGFITMKAINKVEENSPKKLRIICMAISSSECKNGHPSAWSGKIDDLAFGEPDLKRLIVLPAGNTNQNLMTNYPENNKTSPILDPGQSWNALTVGAFTEKDHITDSKYSHHDTLAKAGQISPSSRTSLSWLLDLKNKWPIKPDIVFEGGNYFHFNKNSVLQHEDISLLTTNWKPLEKQFSTISDTSAATALAANMASQLQVKYPNYWPETIRGLLVHSADWTKTLRNQFEDPTKTLKQNLSTLMRISGYGAPDLEKALYSASNHCNLIIQREIQPYILDQDKVRTNEMHLFELPWPKAVLQELGENRIVLKVTLSYFIEPSPGEIGWQNRYRYASHGLRFDINRSSEEETKFRQRINSADQEEGYHSETLDNNWLIGVKQRDFGSLHSDVWVGNAIDLAEQNMLAIFPVIGWWKERKHLGKCNSKARYSLIVSLESPEVDIDLYNLVLAEIKSEQKVPTRVVVSS
jgi:hypothetical protein